MAIEISWEAASNKTACQIQENGKTWISDIGLESGGSGQYPDPHQMLDSALGACTVLTIQIYAKRKAIPLERVLVSITHIEEAGLYQLQRNIQLKGQFTEAQRDDLLRVANKCPIHKVLSGQFTIITQLEN